MATSDDTASFIRKATAKHGERYAYDRVVYKNSKAQVTVVCRKHGPFLIAPNNHIQGRGCRTCRSDLARERYTKPFTSFVGQARELHDAKYQYKESSYRGAQHSMEMICPEHGSFVQRPDAHLHGQGCKMCASIRLGEQSRLSADVFLSRARKKFPRKFDYSHTRYVAMRQPVTIICRRHGAFEKLPVDFLSSKYGCPLCIKKGGPKTTEIFVSQLRDIFRDHYDLSQVIYRSKVTKVRLGCSKHGWFERAPETLLKARGCQKCSKEASEGKRLRNLRRSVVSRLEIRRSAFIEAARKRHGEKFDYSQIRYRTQHDPVTIVCPRHGPFRQSPTNHLNGGCRQCADDDLKGLYSERYFRNWPAEKTRPASLYYILVRTHTEEFYKVGITTTRLSSRFSGYTSRGRGKLEVLRQRSLPLWAAYHVEQEILSQHATKYPYRPLLTNRVERSLVGVTECFSRQLPEDLLARYFP